MRPLRVLYLHPVGKFGGASLSLIELWKVLRTRAVTGVIVRPRGSAAPQFAAHGLQVQPCLGLPQLDNSRYGAYRGARWLVVLRELLLLPVGLLALLRVRRLGPFSVIHVDEIQLLPLGLIARRWLRAPLLVHVRSLQRAPDDGLRAIHREWSAVEAHPAIAT